MHCGNGSLILIQISPWPICYLKLYKFRQFFVVLYILVHISAIVYLYTNNNKWMGERAFSRSTQRIFNEELWHLGTRGMGGWLHPNSHAYKVADASNATCMILVLLFMQNIGASEVASMNIQANTEDTQPFVSWIIVFAECEIIVKKCADFIWAQSNLFGHCGFVLLSKILIYPHSSINSTKPWF